MALPPGIDAAAAAEAIRRIEGTQLAVRNFMAAIFASPSRHNARFSNDQPPTWATHAARKAISQVLPAFEEFEQTDSPRAFGRFLGIIFRVLNDETADTGFPDSDLQAFEACRVAVRPVFPAILAEVCVSEGTDKFEFFSGFGEGCSTDVLSFFGRRGELTNASPRFQLYAALAADWPRIQKLPTTTAIYRHLKANGAVALGDLETFQRLLRGLGLSQTRAGRPRAVIRMPRGKTAS